MHDSAELRALLTRLIVEERIAHVVETGTHEGLGSTRFVAESFPSSAPPRSFVTIEASWRSWRRARRNLRRFAFVQPLWGHTLDVREAVEFIKHDECLREHEKYPDIFIDDVQDPAGFYLREVLGGLGGAPRDLPRRFWMSVDRLRHYRGEGLLERSLADVRDESPLVVLDSAGGTGWLEFTTLLATMKERKYFVLLDDVHHLKHFRSLAHVRSDASFQILGLDTRHGWLLAKHG